MAMYGYVWLYRAIIYGYVGLCRAMKVYLCLCMPIWGYVGLCMAM